MKAVLIRILKILEIEDTNKKVEGMFDKLI